MRQTRPPPPPTGVRRALFRLPGWLYRARLGFLLGHRIVLIEHVGRSSGRRREVVVEVVDRDPGTGTVVVASAFGPRADWYRNLLVHPEARIRLSRRSLRVRASPLEKEQSAEAMLSYARRHPRAAPRLAAFMGYRVDGTDEDFRAVGRRVPMLRLVPLSDR